MTATTERPIYHPPPEGPWARRAADDAGMDPGQLQEAVRFALDHEIDWPVDLARQPIGEDAERWSASLGRYRDRGGPAGLVLRGGYVVAEWGDLDRVDLTYSATKSYVATMAGLALDEGRIRSVEDRVGGHEADRRLEYSPAAVAAIGGLGDVQLNAGGAGAGVDGFDTTQNEGITWRHLLQQTSEWEGWLFGKPDIVDWNRGGGFGAEAQRDERRPPGGHWEYNDVRVNRTALALLCVWGEPLPGVLERKIMDPIGASDTWEWHGYDDFSTVCLDGVAMESVSGGAHWGGGMWISTWDHARFGLLFLRGGVWDGRRLISAEWCRMMREPCARNPYYGFMWWLNTGGARYGKAAGDATFAAMGAGGNSVVCVPDHDLVVVTRWCADVAGVVDRAARAVRC